MLRRAIRGLDTGLFSNVNVREILACPSAHADVKCPLVGVYDNSETAVRIGPKRVYEIGRITQRITAGLVERDFAKVAHELASAAMV